MSQPGPGAEAAWRAVSDELIAGIHHALNNRVGALAAVAQVLQGEMPPGHPLRAALAHEVERLQDTVKSLTLLPARGGAAEPIQLGELFPALLALFELHHGMRDTECVVDGAPDVLPLYAEPPLLAHVLLTLMVAAGRAARAGGGRVRVRYGGDTEWVEIGVAAEGGGEPDTPMDAAAVRPWAERMGGELRAGPDASGFVLRLPTLLEVRRRERERRG